MKIYRIFAALLILLLNSSAVYAYIPIPLKNVSVISSVSHDKSSEKFIYSYLISNPASNESQIAFFQIDISKPLNSEQLMSEGLYIELGYNLNANKVISSSFNEEIGTIQPDNEVVPVSVTLGERNWGGGLSKMSTVIWSGSENTLILPGQTLGGFVIESYGLPTIRDCTIEPAIDYV